jgi:hypothetical protein
MQKFINWLRSLFAQPGNRPVSNRTLESVTAEEIRMERIKVEQTEARISREIEQLEKQKEEFFAKGVGCGSDRQKLQYARKVRELDGQVRARDQQLTLISRNLRVLHGIAQLKDNQRVLRDLGMEGLVNKMNLEDLQRYVEQATVEGQFQMDKFGEVIVALEGAENVFAVGKEDADTLAIVEAMNQMAAGQVQRQLQTDAVTVSPVSSTSVQTGSTRQAALEAAG